MSRKQNWYIKKYVCAVSSFLPCSGKTKKPWLDAIRAQAEGYIAQGGDPAALAERFGTPQQVAAAYVDEMPTAELLAQLHIRRRVVTTVVLAVVAALAVYAGVLLLQLHTIHQDLSGWSESYVTRYEDYENSEIGDTTQ
mgnify:FL=1